MVEPGVGVTGVEGVLNRVPECERLQIEGYM